MVVHGFAILREKCQAVALKKRNERHLAILLIAFKRSSVTLKAFGILRSIR